MLRHFTLEYDFSSSPSSFVRVQSSNQYIWGESFLPIQYTKGKQFIWWPQWCFFLCFFFFFIVQLWTVMYRNNTFLIHFLALFWHLWGTNLNFSNAKVLKSECQKKSTATTTIIAIIPTQDLKYVDLMFFEDCPSKRSIDCNSITQVIWYRTFSLRILIEYIWTMPKPSTSNPIWHKWIERKRQNKVQIVKSYEKHRAMGKKFLENFYRDNENEVKLNCIVGKWLLLKCGIKLEPITFPISNESN